MSPVLTAILILLVPAGLLPVVTAWLLRRYRKEPSQALRDRRQVAIVMALLGVTTSLLAANRLFGSPFEGEVLILPFAIALLLIDLVSGKWLWDYYRGAFVGVSLDERTTVAAERTADATERLADSNDK